MRKRLLFSLLTVGIVVFGSLAYGAVSYAPTVRQALKTTHEDCTYLIGMCPSYEGDTPLTAWMKDKVRSITLGGRLAFERGAEAAFHELGQRVIMVEAMAPRQSKAMQAFNTLCTNFEFEAALTKANAEAPVYKMPSRGSYRFATPMVDCWHGVKAVIYFGNNAADPDEVWTAEYTVESVTATGITWSEATLTPPPRNDTK